MWRNSICMAHFSASDCGEFFSPAICARGKLASDRFYVLGVSRSAQFESVTF